MYVIESYYPQNTRVGSIKRGRARGLMGTCRENLIGVIDPEEAHTLIRAKLKEL